MVGSLRSLTPDVVVLAFIDDDVKRVLKAYRGAPLGRSRD
jgi:hypothetical protein